MNIYKALYSYYVKSENEYYFITDDSVIRFYKKPSWDLEFSISTFNNVKSEVSVLIKKSEFLDVYNLRREMLTKIEKDDNKYLKMGDEILGVSPEYKELFKNGYFSWQSDAPAEEYFFEPEVFKYNCFNIIPLEDEYLLTFINNTNECRFSIEINTDRSRYGKLRFPVWDFFDKLKNVCEKIDYDYLFEEKRKIYNKLK